VKRSVERSKHTLLQIIGQNAMRLLAAEEWRFSTL